MEEEDYNSYSPDGLHVFSGLGYIIFGLFFLIPLYFPFMFIEWIIDDGVNSQSLGLLIGSIVISAPFVIGGLLMVGTGFSSLTGWDPRPKKSLSGNPQPEGRESVVFGGHRSSLGPILLSIFLLPLLLIGPGALIYGFMQLFSGSGTGAVCLSQSVGMIFTIFGYYLVGNALAKRRLRVDHENGILYYETILFSRRVNDEMRPIAEALEVREWVTTSYNDESDTYSERIHHAIFGEGEEGRWIIDITKMTLPNFIDPGEIAETLGVPYKD